MSLLRGQANTSTDTVQILVHVSHVSGGSSVPPNDLGLTAVIDGCKICLSFTRKIQANPCRQPQGDSIARC